MHIRVLTEHIAPVLLVTLFCLRHLQQNFAVGTLGTLRQVAIDARLGFLVGQVAAPTLNLRRGRVGNRPVACRLALKHLGFSAVLIGCVRTHKSLPHDAVRAGYLAPHTLIMRSNLC